ncbi:MAG: GNAT family N-acetyltransferase, partial [Bacteroidetes bacterium]|nr:GNAT family N-acetyltransferase [Bacteroidota bacterium]
GVGTKVVKAAEAAALKYGFNKMDMHARMVAVNFYKKLGYSVVSDTFTEVGIPHVVMEKSLKG